MLWQKRVTIAVCAVVAATLGSTTQADIRKRDFAVHARFDLTDPRGGPFPAIASRSSTRATSRDAVSTSHRLTAARTRMTVKTS